MLVREKILDLFFPWYCIGCGKINEKVCNSCLAKIETNPDISNNYFVSKYVDGVWVAANFTDQLLQKIIYNFKYRSVKELGHSLEIILERYLTLLVRADALPKIDLVVPIPISNKRLLSRGFNQTEILATAVARIVDLPLANRALKRQHRDPQVGYDAVARQQNIKNVFTLIDGAAILNKRILIIDDVMTTGATIDELARVFKAAGAKRVWGLVVAKN